MASSTTTFPNGLPDKGEHSKWLAYVIRHVKIQAKSVERTLCGRDMEEAREMVLEFLDGYLIWLKDDSRISKFKASFYAMTTFLFSSDPSDQTKANKSNKADTKATATMEDKIESPKKTGAEALQSYGDPPTNSAEARRNLEAYLVLWKTLYSICESTSHASNRLAQLFDWEANNHGPLFKISRLLAFPNQNSIEEKLYDNDSFLAHLDPSTYTCDQLKIYFTESDIADFYQDGMKALEGRKINFDDLHDCATFRIKPSNCETPAPPTETPRMKTWTRKTFYEPEGIKAGLVAFRNYYAILFLNVYLTLGAWAWFDPIHVTVVEALLCDGVASTLGCFVEVASRWAIYPCRKLFTPELPWWALTFQVLLYLIGLGEVGLWFLSTQLKVLPTSLTFYIQLATLGASIALRSLFNLLLFLKLPVVNKAHHKRKSSTCSKITKLFWKCLIFCIFTAAILVPLFYWFVVPTLERSAFWAFCISPQLVTTIQCYIGIIGLWIPLLSVILIMDFIGYSVVLSLYGAYLAQIGHVGYINEESFSVMAGFRRFASLLRRWAVPGGPHEFPSHLEQPDAKLSKSITNSTSTQDNKSGSISSSSSTDQSTTPKKKKHKKSQNDQKTIANGNATNSVRVNMSTFSDLTQVESELATMRNLWYLIVDDLFDLDLISKDTARSLYVALNWQDVPLGSKPKELIQFFFSSLSSLSNKDLHSIPENYLLKLPSVTQLIPSYGEAVIFDTAYLCNRDNKPISNIEFLVLKYEKEWEYFFHRMQLAFSGTSYTCHGSSGVRPLSMQNSNIFHRGSSMFGLTSSYTFPSSPQQMLVTFLQSGSKPCPRLCSTLHPDLHDEIRLWCSLRGQTLYKTIRGTLSYRMALTAIYEATGHSSSIVSYKCQVILAHQQYGDPSMLRQIANDVVLVYKKLSSPGIVGKSLYGDTPFDLVFDWSPRDLIAQDTFRKKLSQQQNEEIIRRYTLKTIFNETEDICAHGEALKRLIDSKAGDCVIDPKQGFPFASIIAGLPTATRISGKTFLFKFKGNPNEEFVSRAPSHGGNGDSYYGGDSTENSEDLADGDSGKRKRPETFRWEYLARGSAAVLAPSNTESSLSFHDPPAWLRCFNEETGREYDFLVRRNMFDVKSISYFKISARSLLHNNSSSSHDPSVSSSTEESTSAVDGKSSNRLDPFASTHRVYAVIKFGVKHPWNRDKHEVFAIVCCLNDDQFTHFATSDPRYHDIESMHFASNRRLTEITPIGEVETNRQVEIACIQRALTRPKTNLLPDIDSSKLNQKTRRVLTSIESLHEVLSEYASDHSFDPENVPVAQDIFLGIEVKAIMPRRHSLILRVAPDLPFGDSDRIQGKAANQMNGLRFAFGNVVQTKDANQGGNVAEALKFPIILQRFEIHTMRDRSDQIRYLKKWYGKNRPKPHTTLEDWLQKTNGGQNQCLQLSELLSYNHSLLSTSSSSSDFQDMTNSVELDDLTKSKISSNAPKTPPISKMLSPSTYRSTSIDSSKFSLSTKRGLMKVLLAINLCERSVPMLDEYERDTSKAILPPSILGFREAVFTRSHGAVARFQAYAEWTFGTIVQRVLSKLNLRMHYGHPDFFAASWVFSRSSMSKANPVYNLSEDIFAGYMALMNDRRSAHTDQIQDEKGRDTSLASTYTFTAKLAQGAASQMKSRDLFMMNSRLDFLKQFLLFHSSIGYYFTTTAMLTSVKMYLFGLVVFSLAGYSAQNLGNLQFIYSVPFLVQVGMFTLLPLILEVGVEEGAWSVLKVVVDLPFSLGYFLFQGQTTAHHLVESFIKGKSHYEATGRLLGVSRKSLVDCYQLYGRSHFEPALDYLFYVVVYYIISSSRYGGYLPLFAPIICIVVFIIAPTGFQIANSFQGIFNDVGAFGRWIYTTEPFGALLKEWRAAPLREQMIRNLTWKATFKTTHTRLQTYSLFHSLKNVMTTHWRVDVATTLYQFARALLWGFIILTIPGTMKDSVLKVLIGFTLYLLLAMGISSITPHNKKGCWQTTSNLLFVLSIGYFVALFVLLAAWRFTGDFVIGIFLSLKFLKSASLVVFHMAAIVMKSRAARRWRNVEHQFKKNKIPQEEKERTTKEIKAELEKKLLSGLYAVDVVDRSFTILSLSIVLIPTHIIFNLFWCIPPISHYLMYSKNLVPEKSTTELTTSNSPHWNTGGFNSIGNPDDMDELPSFDFEGDVDFY